LHDGELLLQSDFCFAVIAGSTVIRGLVCSQSLDCLGFQQPESETSRAACFVCRFQITEVQVNWVQVNWVQVNWVQVNWVQVNWGLNPAGIARGCGFWKTAEKLGSSPAALDLPCGIL